MRVVLALLAAAALTLPLDAGQQPMPSAGQQQAKPAGEQQPPAAGAGQQPAQPTPGQPPQPAPTPPQEPAPAPGATRPSFAEFLAAIRTEARTLGISEATIDAALSDIDEPVPAVIERDRAQAEIVLPLEKYLAQHVTTTVVRHGRDAYAEHRELLARVSAAYGVPPGIIVAIWGVESNFGRFSGVRPTIASLVTLAWDLRRASFFRGELFDALSILDRGDIDLAHLKGSWAGAMGQVQFMPSSYLQYAEDFDGDGRRDIWSSPADVFASIANYLKAHGWQAGRPWGREVRIPREADKRITRDVAWRNGSCIATRDMTVALPLAQWRRLGVRSATGGPLPSRGPDAAMVGGASRHFLVTANYDALLDYNCAHSYALSVALLADRIISKGPIAGEKRPKHARAPKRRG